MLPADGIVGTVVLVLHGGRARSNLPMQPWRLAYLRMLPFAHAAHRAANEAPAHAGTAVCLLRNHLRGWNEPQRNPIRDARWALSELRRIHPAANIVLVGHSMGGRAALRLAGDDGVTAVCALAPWIERDEPIRQLSGKSVLIIHGDRDRMTSQHASADYVRRASRSHPDVRFVPVAGSGHAMLRHSGLWTSLVRGFTRDAVTTIGPSQHRQHPCGQGE
ncbi:alpha/beta hydrolase [Haloactinomyces albus]|uniref:Dienelactone hydrolase n=1 Tax=Haloactinomyces albus TaxID=1352928 RepID=A0AAE3Z9H2_9ACTN|nr:alpha/beta family hydrolase [Haloactinomyces albus]MDR7300798.1 dienelactone hydrolase [Haloactinomyces albus]